MPRSNSDASDQGIYDNGRGMGFMVGGVLGAGAGVGALAYAKRVTDQRRAAGKQRFEDYANRMLAREEAMGENLTEDMIRRNANKIYRYGQAIDRSVDRTMAGRFERGVNKVLDNRAGKYVSKAMGKYGRFLPFVGVGAAGLAIGGGVGAMLDDPYE